MACRRCAVVEVSLRESVSASPFADGRHCLQSAALYQNLIELLNLDQNPSELALSGHFSLVPLAI